MRRLLAIFLSLSLCPALFAALPLTVKEISLMLRSGYSSDTVLRELSIRHFADTIDSSTEQQLVRAGANANLVSALQNGAYAASPAEISAASQRQRPIEPKPLLAPGSQLQASINNLPSPAPPIAAAAAAANAPATSAATPAGSPGPPDFIARYLQNELVSMQNGDLRPFDDRILASKRLFLFYVDAQIVESFHKFTPKLIEYCDRVSAEHPELQTIFISEDRSPFDMDKLMRQTNMPWPAMRFDRLPVKFKMVRAVAALPAIILVAGDTTILYMSTGTDNNEPEKILANLDHVLSTSSADPRAPFPKTMSSTPAYLRFSETEAAN